MVVVVSSPNNYNSSFGDHQTGHHKKLNKNEKAWDIVKIAKYDRDRTWANTVGKMMW